MTAKQSPPARNIIIPLVFGLASIALTMVNHTTGTWTAWFGEHAFTAFALSFLVGVTAFGIGAMLCWNILAGEYGPDATIDD